MFMSASHSEIETWVECERKHFYRYGKRLESKEDNETMSRGNIIHEVLSEYYLQRKLGADHFAAMEHALPYLGRATDRYNLYDAEKMQALCRTLLYWYWETYQNDTWKILEVEVDYKVQLTSDFQLPVKIDLIVEDPFDGIGLVDHKVCYDFFSVDKVDMSPQLPRYLAVALELGIKPNFLMYNQIRWRNTKDNQADPTLRFQRTPVPVTTEKVVTIMREHMMSAEKISHLRSLGVEKWEQNVVRNPSACQYCNFKDLCDADMNNRDAQLTQDSFYRERVRRDVAQEVVS